MYESIEKTWVFASPITAYHLLIQRIGEATRAQLIPVYVAHTVACSLRCRRFAWCPVVPARLPPLPRDQNVKFVVRAAGAGVCNQLWETSKIAEASNGVGSTCDVGTAVLHVRMWDGFTDDDLERLKAGERLGARARELPAPVPVPVVKRQAPHLRGSAKKNIARERMLLKPNKTSNGPPNCAVEELPVNARLSKPKEPFIRESSDENPLLAKEELQEDVENSTKKEKELNGTAASPLNSRKSSIETSTNIGPVCIKIKEGKNYEVMSSDKTPLDEFQSRHKLMEEQNRRRKELLAKALADRKKQTIAEARRLQHIQDELQKLDALLSNDVGILRDQIEAASLEFMDAQKRYDKAEKEFLEAKLHLFGKLERKELLTEHLCKIIEQNEMRKAKKLSELMDKLDLSSNGDLADEEQKNTIGSAMLPTLCALDEVSYTACNTLKHRQSESSLAHVRESEHNDKPVLESELQVSQEKSEDSTEVITDENDSLEQTQEGEKSQGS